MILYALGSAFTLWMAVECVRRGQTHPWIWIILFIPTLGAAVYFFTEFLGTHPFRFERSRRASKRELHHARAEVKRLDNSESWTQYAHCLRSRGRAEEATEAASRAVEKDPENRSALYELGLARLACERFEEAAAELARLVDRDPGHDSGEARYALAVAREKSGDKDAARRCLESLARTSSLPKILFRLASLQAETGDPAGARESLQRIIEESEYVPKYHRRQVRPWVRRARKALAALPRLSE